MAINVLVTVGKLYYSTNGAIFFSISFRILQLYMYFITTHFLLVSGLDMSQPQSSRMVGVSETSISRAAFSCESQKVPDFSFQFRILQLAFCALHNEAFLSGFRSRYIMTTISRDGWSFRNFHLESGISLRFIHYYLKPVIKLYFLLCTCFIVCQLDMRS